MPKLDANMQTEISGLFYAASAHIDGGFKDTAAAGHIAGRAASVYAASNGRTSVVWDEVNEILNHTYELLERDQGDGIRATQVLRNIQIAFGEGLGTLRDEAGMQAALDEFKRIKNEDIPKMYVSNKTKQFNVEWRNALEVEYMIDVAIAIAMSSLERKETRAFPARTDYIEADHQNYLKKIIISKNGDDFTLDAEATEMSIIDAETYPMAMPPLVNLNSYELFRNSK
jgi:succinate dehydrogenase/fumarate reductase flavoprotein subunit